MPSLLGLQLAVKEPLHQMRSTPPMNPREVPSRTRRRIVPRGNRASGHHPGLHKTAQKTCAPKSPKRAHFGTGAYRIRIIKSKLPWRLVKKLNETARKYRRTREEIIRVALEDWLIAKEGYEK